MSKSIKSIVALSVVVVVAACAKEPVDEFVVVDPTPISVEPTQTGKYK
ncbi:MAG: hypothetical protein ACU0A2_06820 [Cognatishimia sp.]|jgi:hypothetical protein